jgi:hypothetical protein
VKKTEADYQTRQKKWNKPNQKEYNLAGCTACIFRVDE